MGYIIALICSAVLTGAFSLLAKQYLTIFSTPENLALMQNTPINWSFGAPLASVVVAFLYVLVTQGREPKARQAASIQDIERLSTGNYRRAELRLIRLGKISRDQIIQYHQNYNWSVYSGLAFSTIFVVVSINFARAADYMTLDGLATYLGVILLSFSTVALVIVDMFHTNTLTPVVPIDRRFKIIDLVLKLGGLALMAEVCAAGFFLFLVSPYISLFSSVVSLLLMVFLTNRRKIFAKELIAEYRLSEDEIKYVLGLGPYPMRR